MAMNFKYSKCYRAMVWICDSVTTAKQSFTSLELSNELKSDGMPHDDKDMRNALARMVRAGDLLKEGNVYTWARWNDWAN